jgi:hypothetical protein
MKYAIAIAALVLPARREPTNPGDPILASINPSASQSPEPSPALD